MQFLRMFLSGFIGAPAEPLTQPSTLAAGQLYCFETLPATTFSPPETGRYAAIKILGIAQNCAVVAVLEGVWTTPPSLDQARRRRMLTRKGLVHEFQPTVDLSAVYGVPLAAWKPTKILRKFHFIGNSRITWAERKHVKDYVNNVAETSYCGLLFIGCQAEYVWRKAHDQNALMSEYSQQEAAQKLEQERLRELLDTITFEKILAQTPLESWSRASEHIPEAFTLAARERLHQACISLQNLGPKPRKREVRAILKAVIIWFNKADDAAGSVIETQEREDIMSALEGLAYAAKQPSLMHEMDEWRTW